MSELQTGRLIQAQTRPESDNISPNPKTNLKSKSCPKKRESLIGRKNLAMLPGYFDYILLHRKKNSTP